MTAPRRPSYSKHSPDVTLKFSATLAALIAAGVFAATWFTTRDPFPADARSHAQPQLPLAAPEAAAQRATPNAPPGAANAPAPTFGAPMPVQDNRAQRIAARKLRALAAGFDVHERYFHMGLDELSRLADAGDLSARVQLALQYEQEVQFLMDDPAYDRKINPAGVADHHYLLLAKAGFRQIPGMMVQKALNRNQRELAYAWSLAADKMAAPGSLALANSPEFAAMSAIDRVVGIAMYEELARHLGLPPPPAGATRLPFPP